MSGQTVQVWLDSTLIGSAVTDGDGYYTISYKATGKATTYTVTVVNPASNVLVQSGGGTNGNVEADFPLMP